MSPAQRIKADRVARDDEEGDSDSDGRPIPSVAPLSARSGESQIETQLVSKRDEVRGKISELQQAIVREVNRMEGTSVGEMERLNQEVDRLLQIEAQIERAMAADSLRRDYLPTPTETPRESPHEPQNEEPT